MNILIIKKINLKPGEEVAKVVRRYGLILWPKILAVFLLLTLPFFFLFPLFKFGPWGAAVFCFLILLGAIYGLRTFVIWYFNALVITSQRLVDIDQRGFFERVVSEVSYEKIQDVSYRRKGIWQTIFHYGNVRIRAAGATVDLEFQNIKNPEKIQEMVADLSHLDKKRSEAAGGAGDMEIAAPAPNEEEFKIIKKTIDDLDERQLEELDGIARNKLRREKLRRLEQIREK